MAPILRKTLKVGGKNPLFCVQENQHGRNERSLPFLRQVLSLPGVPVLEAFPEANGKLSDPARVTRRAGRGPPASPEDQPYGPAKPGLSQAFFC